MTSQPADSFDPARVTASLRRMGLVDLDETPALTALTGGVSSLILRADTCRGPMCFKQALPQLKTAKEWKAPVERARAEAGWLALAAECLPGQAPLLLGWDDTELALAMEYLEPVDYPVWKALLRDGVIETTHAQGVAIALAKVHEATAHRDDLAQRFGHDAQFYALRLESYLVATGRVHPALAPRLAELMRITQSTKRALVHGDVSPKNILVGPRGPVFLDAETAWYGDPAFDLAFCLNHLLLKCAWRPQWSARYLACYDTLADTYLDATRYEARPQVESRVAALLPGLFLARIDGKSPVDYITDDVWRDRVRRAAIPLLERPVATLAEVRARWEQELPR